MSPTQISYQSIESSDPGINVPGPRRTVSKLKNETYHMFSNLHPGTTYLISVRARTAKGFGQTALTEITTNISGEEEAEGAAVGSLGEAGRWRHQQALTRRALYLESHFFSLSFDLSIFPLPLRRGCSSRVSDLCFCFLFSAPPPHNPHPPLLL